MQIFKILILCFAISAVLAAKRKGKKGKKAKNDTPKRVLSLKAESLLNIQLVRATSVEIGFSYIQGAEGFMVTAKEWIDGKFVQSIATDRQFLDVQQRSAILKNLIPGREYLIEVQATNAARKPVGTVAGKVVRTSQNCYVCNGVKENDDCNREHDLVECPHDKDACANVVRYDAGRMTISKRCAQYNPSLTKACSGKENAKDSVCKCMCRSNECNKPTLPCVDECLDKLPMPLQSFIECTNDNKVGSICKWKCERDYEVKGLAESTCRPDRTWSVLSPPQCVYKAGSGKIPRKGKVPRLAKQCRALEVEHGEVSCSAGNKARSVCTFKCISGFTHVKGSKSRICVRGSKWTGTPFVCKEITCSSHLEQPGVVKCSNDSKIGSVCDVTKPSKLTCQSDGSWTSNDICNEMGPQAHSPQQCEPVTAPKFGDVICTNGNKANSICEFACARGYDVVGKTPFRECKNGKWTGQPITCKERKCSPLIERPYVKEVIKCSNDDKIGSVCNVVTPSIVTCQADGTWTPPLTQESKCKECKCP